MEQQLEVWKPLLQKIQEWDDKKSLEVKTFDENLIPAEINVEAIKSIPKIEAEVKRLTALSKITKDERLEYTRKIDEVSKNLMKHEKAYEESIAKIKAKLLPLKIFEDKHKAELLKRANEIVEFKRNCLYDLNNQVSEAKSAIQAKVSLLYKNALEDEEEQSAEFYLESYIDTFTEEQFVCRLPDKFEKDNEKNDIIDLVYSSFIPYDLMIEFQNELENAFKNLDSDRIDKKKALEMRKAVEDKAVQEVLQEKTTNDAFVQVVSVHQDQLFAKTKSVKKKLVLNMPRTKESMFKILQAFAPHLDTASMCYKGKDYFDIIEKIADLVTEMKNKGIEFTSLTFKEETIL